MKQQPFKIFSVLAVIILAGYFLYPTFQDYSIKEKFKTMTSSDSAAYVEQNRKDIEHAEDNKLKLGLDLQGGMYVVLEVDLYTLLDKLATMHDANLDSLIKVTRAQTSNSGDDPVEVLVSKAKENNIRLSRYYGEISQDNSEIETYLHKQRDDAVSRALQIIRTRIDQFGVSEPSITKQGAGRIIVELPGATDEARVRRLIKSTALLEFKLFAKTDVASAALKTANDMIAAKFKTSGIDSSTQQILNKVAQTPADTSGLGAEKNKTDMADQVKNNPLLARLQITGQPMGPIAYASEFDRQTINNYLAMPEVKAAIPSDISFQWSAKPIGNQSGVNIFGLYALEAKAAMDGGSIVDARATIGTEFNRPEVSMKMDADGAREWAYVTGANVDKPIAIVLDGTVFSAPRVNQKITGGNSSISGLENIEEARDLENVLKAGALPAPVNIVQERTVGPSLGADAIAAGLNSTIWGLVAVAVVMIAYYSVAGILANIVLLVNLIVILGVMAAFHGTLTLPGIAGIILTIGMAVDANVLIYERLREELETGKTMKMVVESGYSKAWTAIFDSNITTFFTGVILYTFGVGPIKGFALTLMIGIVTSLFTASVVTRLIFDYMLAKPNSKLHVG